MEERIKFLASDGVLNYNAQDKTITLDNLKAQAPVLEMFFKMCEVFVDSYMVVLMGLNHINQKGMIIKQKLLVHELHQTIKHLYLSKVLPHLHSCLVELLWASMHRFENCNYIEVVSYGNKQGSQTNLLMSSQHTNDKLAKTLDFMR